MAKFANTRRSIIILLFYPVCGSAHLGLGAFQRVNGLGLVQLRFHVTLGDTGTQ